MLNLCGAGSSKSTISRTHLTQLDESEWSWCATSLNRLTKPSELQDKLGLYLEKQPGNIHAPRDDKKLVFFIDDSNMASSDEYGTQPVFELLREMIAHGLYYDTHTGQAKRTERLQFMTAFTAANASECGMHPRLRWRFSSMLIWLSTEVTEHIFCTVLNRHLDIQSGVNGTGLKQAAAGLVQASMKIHSKIQVQFQSTR